MRMLCFESQMIQTLAKDRLERLNASPSANQWIYLRVFSALLFVLISDICWYFLAWIYFLFYTRSYKNIYFFIAKGVHDFYITNFNFEYTLILVFYVTFRICLCLVIIGNAPIGIFMLLFFEPLSIAFETLQVVQ